MPATSRLAPTAINHPQAPRRHHNDLPDLRIIALADEDHFIPRTRPEVLREAIATIANGPR